MKVAGLLLLVAGWFLVVSAVALFVQTARGVFVLAGLCVQLIGLLLALRSGAHLPGEAR